MNFEGNMPFKMHKIDFFFQKRKDFKKVYVPTLPKIFRPLTQNTLIFLFGLSWLSTEDTSKQRLITKFQ